MALTGVHIACTGVNVVNGASLVGNVIWSQTMASAGTTTQAAPSQNGMAFEISPANDIYIAKGATPDATGTNRLLVRSGETRNILAFPGEYIAWVLA